MDFAAEDPKITNLRRLGGALMLALFSIEFRSGTVMNYCLLEYMDDKRTLTVRPPRVPRVDFRGVPIKDAAGRTVFDSAISFRNASVRSHFIATALQALRQQHPEVFPDNRP